MIVFCGSFQTFKVNINNSWFLHRACLFDVIPLALHNDILRVLEKTNVFHVSYILNLFVFTACLS